MIKKTKRKSDIIYPIITYKDSENNSFEYQPDEWEIEELLEELIGENTTQNKDGLIYIDNNENYTCNEDCFEEQLANYIAERVKELFISYYDMIKERLQEEALDYHNSQMAEDDLVFDSKVPEFGRKRVFFDLSDIEMDGDFSNNTSIANLAKEYGIQIDKLTDGTLRGEKELIIDSGSFENIINLFKTLGVIKPGGEIAVTVYYDSSSDIYSLDQILSKAEKANIYVASYVFEEAKDYIQLVGAPENINKFLEDVVSNYDVATETDEKGNKSLKPEYYEYDFTIDLRDNFITELRNQPLKFESDKQLDEKDEETIKNLKELYEEYDEDTIDDITSPYGDFAASLKPLFNSKYTIEFHKEPYLTTDIGIYDDIYKTWKACFLFAIKYNGDIDKFMKDDFYKENATSKADLEKEKEEELNSQKELNLGGLGEERKRRNQEYKRSGSYYRNFSIQPYRRNGEFKKWKVILRNQISRKEDIVWFDPDYTPEELERYAKVAYDMYANLDFDFNAFKNTDVYKRAGEIAKGTYNPDIPSYTESKTHKEIAKRLQLEEEQEKEENAKYKNAQTFTFEYNAFVNDPFNEEFSSEEEFRKLANRLNVNVLEYNTNEEGKEASFKVSGLKKNILSFIDVLFDFDFDNEQQEIDFLVKEGYLKTN